MVGETDKSNKVLVVDMESIERMEEVHTGKDEQVHMAHVEEMARTHDQQLSMLVKILKLGDSHGH